MGLLLPSDLQAVNHGLLLPDPLDQVHDGTTAA